jgi:phosphoribosyl 1,2-cyclic phosphodiesterase
VRVAFWGTRGSIAKAGPSTLRYGGNTSCVEVTSDAGTLIVIDCGTGAHGLGVDLQARSNGAPIHGHLLIGHTHWDHIQGLPFFAPLFQPGNTWHIYGPRGLGGSVIDTLAGQMQYSYFPITIEQLAAQVDYHDLVEGTFDIDDVTVTTQYLNHPALTLGYRLEADGATVVYASDHEPHRPDLGGGGDLRSSPHDRDHGRFLHGADLLIHDAQYVAGEYGSKRGWGHSTVEYVVDAARQEGVARVALYHHDPARSDDAIDAIVAQARRRSAAEGYAGDVFAAAEGMSIEVVGSRSRPDRDANGSGRATSMPALEQVRRSVLIAVQRPEIAAVLREAAAAEQLEIWEADDPTTAAELTRDHHPALVVLEETGDLPEQGRAIRSLVGSSCEDVSIVAVSPSAAHHAADPSITDWLLWPASAGYVRTRLHAWLLRRACRWQNAPLPPDEERRVQALHDLGVLDTEREERFDLLTAEASTVLDVPVALVSLIDVDRQWFKSTHGIDATESPRDSAFCAHAILGDRILQVPDALQDPRFADHPAVRGEPRIRFYAGVPLRLSDGSAVGSLCVLDYRPRVLDEEQLAVLREVGRRVARELEHR